MNKERSNETAPADLAGQTGQTGDTVRIRKPPRVFTTVLGQNIWMGDVEPCELELENPASTDPYDSAASDDPWAGV